MPEPPSPSLPPLDDAYRVDLDMYAGPLELLLYLIRREEVDIQNIPIAHITQQYLRHVETIRHIDINLAGEFLVMAATLMEIKSRMLLPRPAPDPDAPESGASVEDFTDPRAELVRQLLAYKEFKDAAETLRRRAATETARYPRAVPRSAGIAPLEIEDLDLFRLIDAFNAIMASVGHSAFGHEVVYDDTPLSLHQADLLDRLTRDGPLSLQAIFAGRTKKTDMIGLFLATLELIRQKRILIAPAADTGAITLELRPPDDAVMFAESDVAAPAATGPALTPVASVSDADPPTALSGLASPELPDPAAPPDDPN